MVLKMTAPKKKEEFVETLSQLTTISPTVLGSMSVEKLRVIYQTARPQPVAKPLANWRRFAKSELQQLYVEKAKPWYGIPMEDMEYLKWGRDRMIIELMNYVEEVKDEMPQLDADPLGPPTCPKCSVKMVERINRQTREPFWGCLTFPLCRETFSKVKDPAENPVGYPQPASGSNAKSTVIDGNGMDGTAVKRAVRAQEQPKLQKEN